ncbi:glucosamine-6-phosphate isomerase [Vineibacter terrae]|uniref:Glucosamine-6-phosphate isomerase n=1 Tax=Vineibacter terrae TaxID=2586908 RepID=A0A5C8P6P9_9HYPH|nr:glucosamine-6-phosphate isomerase [Vineibacter terrae]TXL69167.1 glucosamine-6-phosphate isomerase [Vineibacter terrae]
MNALAIRPEDLGRGSPCRLAIVDDADALAAAFAQSMITAYRAAKAAGRPQVVFIVPVGPVGQFERLAAYANEARLSLADLVLINMDEYLSPDGRDFIAPDDPLSFRGHMQRHLWDRLDPALAPPASHRHFPDPRRPEATTALIARLGGVDVAFGGVGITGHLAFNDPPEPGDGMDLDSFAALPTRVVRLSRETLTINAVTAARGNIDRIPRLAVTVGMAEILASRQVRIFMNRTWHCAIVRKLLHGPVTPAVPASLLQRHPDVVVTITRDVAQLPEPELR